MISLVGEFSVFQIKGGRYRAVAQLKDEAGRPLKPKQLERQTESEVRAEMKKWLSARTRLVPSVKMTVEALCDAYIARCVQKGRAEGTVEDYRSLQRNYITGTIGHIQVSTLMPAHVEMMMDSAPAKSAINARAFLRAAINKVARKADPNLPNVASLAEPPSYHPGQDVQLTPENFAKVLQAEKDPMRKAMWLLLSDTGLRPHDEAGRLTWFEIHKKEDGWWIQMDKSKTQEGKKPVPISETTKAALDGLPRKSAYIFPSSRGKKDKPFGETAWRDWWAAVQETAGVPVTNIYQLRHFFGTVQARSVKKHVLARLMRHTDPRTTEKYYVDPFPSELRATKD